MTIIEWFTEGRINMKWLRRWFERRQTRKLVILVTGWTLMMLFAAAAFAQDFAPEVSKAMDAMYVQATPSYMGYGKVEFHFTVHADGTPSPVTSSHDYMRDKVHVEAGDHAIFHTHPYGCDPKPSTGDAATAHAAGIPNYVLSRAALWVVYPDGTVTRVGSVVEKHGHIVVQ